MVSLLIANIIGTQYGFYYYHAQLSKTPFDFYVFVPYCPLYTLFMVLIIGMFILKYEIPSLLAGITFVGLVKYGIWTEFVFFIFPEYFFSPALFNQTIILIFLHIGMILEAFLLVPFVSGSKSEFYLMLSWFLINDFFDYYLGTAPLLPASSMHYVLALESVIVSFAVSFIIYRLAQSRTC